MSLQLIGQGLALPGRGSFRLPDRDFSVVAATQ
jgi:hypothetical protein